MSDHKTSQTYLSSTLFLLLINLIIIIVIPVFPLSLLVFFPHLYVALGGRWQHCGWQYRGRWTGTGRHGGHDLGCDGGRWWSRRLGWRHHRPAILGHHFVVTWEEPLLDRVVLGFRRLGCEWLSWVGQGASGRGVRGEAKGRDGAGGGDVRAEVWILRGETRGGVGGMRAEGGCCRVSGLTGGEVVKRLQGGADGQILFICHDSQSITHQAVGQTSICLFSDPTADKQTVHTRYSDHKYYIKVVFYYY